MGVGDTARGSAVRAGSFAWLIKRPVRGEQNAAAGATRRAAHHFGLRLEGAQQLGQRAHERHGARLVLRSGLGRGRRRRAGRVARACSAGARGAAGRRGASSHGIRMPGTAGYVHDAARSPPRERACDRDECKMLAAMRRSILDSPLHEGRQQQREVCVAQPPAAGRSVLV